MRFSKSCVAIIVAAFVLSACGEDPAPPVQNGPDENQLPPAEERETSNAPDAKVSSAANASYGGVTARIVPENATTSDCLRVFAQGNPGRGNYQWMVNGQPVTGQVSGQFCGDHFKRGDQVQVMVGTQDHGALVGVVIGNSPPRIVDISSTPEQVAVGVPIEVFPVAEDLDGDEVEFSYQWLIDGEVEPFLTEAVLPAESFRAGNTVQVMITANDGYDDGPVYQSYAMTIANTPPQITSRPPQEFKSLEYSYSVVAVDPDDDVLTYRLENAPEGMTIDSRTGQVEWPLVNVQPGSYKVSIVVEDSVGNQQYQEFDLNLGTEE